MLRTTHGGCCFQATLYHGGMWPRRVRRRWTVARCHLANGPRGQGVQAWLMHMVEAVREGEGSLR